MKPTAEQDVFAVCLRHGLSAAEFSRLLKEIAEGVDALIRESRQKGAE